MIYSSRKFITQNYNPKQNHHKYKRSTAQTCTLLPTLNPKEQITFVYEFTFVNTEKLLTVK